MRRRSASRILLIPATLLAGGLASLADGPQDDKAKAAEAVLRAKPDVKSFSIHPVEGGEAFRLHPESILKWTNSGGGFFGNVFVWMAKGRPEVVASVNDFHGTPRRRELEVHSLSTGVFVADRKKSTLWTPKSPGIEWKPLPAAPAPVDSLAGRLRQMREIAREFTAWKINDEAREDPLRLLVQPIHRYGAEGTPTIDGALFAFVEGTDPEIFLMIEDRMVDGRAAWQFAAARFTRFKLRLDRRGEAAWTMPRIFWPQVIDHSQPYTDFDLES